MEVLLLIRLKLKRQYRFYSNCSFAKIKVPVHLWVHAECHYCVVWRDCVIMSLVSIIGKPFALPHSSHLWSPGMGIIAADLIAVPSRNQRVGNKYQILFLNILISLWYQVVTFHISISKARPSNSVLMSVTSRECHVASRGVTKCHAEINPREREAWQHIPRTAPGFISILSRGGEHKWRGENVTLCYIVTQSQYLSHDTLHWPARGKWRQFWKCPPFPSHRANATQPLYLAIL